MVSQMEDQLLLPKVIKGEFAKNGTQASQFEKFVPGGEGGEY